MKKVLLYTVHKSASMFLHSLLEDLARLYRLDHFSMNYEKMFEPIRQRSWNEYIDQNDGIFGPIRILEAEPNIPADLSNYSVILHTRGIYSLPCSTHTPTAIKPGRAASIPRMKNVKNGSKEESITLSSGTR